MIAVRSSVSSAGASVITLQFGLSISLDVAEQEVQAAINAAGNLLPSDLPAPPIYAKVNPADAPILTLGLTSKTMPLTQVEDFVDTRLAQKISQLPGVGLVSISGGQRPTVRVRADIRKLAEKHFVGLTLLLEAFENRETPYLSRPFPKFQSRFSDYDHLARVKEWAIAGDDEETGDAP